MRSTKAKGMVFSGEGVGSQFVGIAWVQKQIKEKLGFDPCLGTLNVRLPEREAELLERFLRNCEGIEITPAKGFFRARCFKALIMNRIRGAVVIPETPNYQSNVLEIIAPVCLRKALSLVDSDEVEIKIFLDIDSHALRPNAVSFRKNF